MTRNSVARREFLLRCARLGLSASTASLAFSGAGPVSEANRAKVLAAAKKLDYAGPPSSA